MVQPSEPISTQPVIAYPSLSEETPSTQPEAIPATIGKEVNEPPVPFQPLSLCPRRYDPQGQVGELFVVEGCEERQTRGRGFQYLEAEQCLRGVWWGEVYTEGYCAAVVKSELQAETQAEVASRDSSQVTTMYV